MWENVRCVLGTNELTRHQADQEPLWALSAFSRHSHSHTQFLFLSLFLSLVLTFQINRMKVLTIRSIRISTLYFKTLLQVENGRPNRLFVHSSIVLQNNLAIIQIHNCKLITSILRFFFLVGPEPDLPGYPITHTWSVPRGSFESHGVPCRIKARQSDTDTTCMKAEADLFWKSRRGWCWRWRERTGNGWVWSSTRWRASSHPAARQPSRCL